MYKISLIHAQLNQLIYNLNTAIEISLGTRMHSFITHFLVVVEILRCQFHRFWCDLLGGRIDGVAGLVVKHVIFFDNIGGEENLGH
jgi:hypothetical protein